jgi:hypothetical protein
MAIPSGRWDDVHIVVFAVCGDEPGATISRYAAPSRS